ncbi:MAG TPA: hypothetical protein ENI96_11550 [Sedimenticola thiotaurini]|uniref:Alginate export domain-containing protein n=1 Tax=Sedimenticola thiotaurini TaxID=1543721 RepID=A0A831RPG1_9GAMM|nr:hypothetical protein [Sedimenticola thiotaurini]
MQPSNVPTGPETLPHDGLGLARRLAGSGCGISLLLLLALLLPGAGTVAAEGPADDEILIEEDAGAAEGDSIVIDGEAAGMQGDGIAIEPEGGGSGEEEPVVIDGEPADVEGEGIVIEPEGGGTGEAASVAVEAAPAPESGERESGSLRVRVDRLWAEYGYFPASDSYTDQQGYLHGRAMLDWRITPAWELRATVRADGYYQWGGVDSNRTRLDYGESYLRYQRENTRITIGAQAIIWGRIDEIPPSDRLSTVDMSRFILDDLEDRRRAAPVIRLEQFIGAGKLDLVYLPWFRAAELPDQESVWYPVRQSSGQIMGLKSTPALSAIIRNAGFTTDAPDGNGGFGARYTGSAGALDYGLTLSRTRQSTPYFRYDPARNLFEAQYPRSWSVAGDMGLEAWGATWRLEGAWFSDTPVTGTGGGYDTVASVSYGGGVEFYPGDGDTRVNLQLTGMNMSDPPSDPVDRTDIYSFNGSFETPFDNGQWRLGMRFYIGLGENDVYLNPKLSWLGWEPFEFYLQAHYFQGGDGTPGGFHEDDSLVTLGWRAHF